MIVRRSAPPSPCLSPPREERSHGKGACGAVASRSGPRPGVDRSRRSERTALTSSLDGGQLRRWRLHEARAAGRVHPRPRRRNGVAPLVRDRGRDRERGHPGDRRPADGVRRPRRGAVDGGPRPAAGAPAHRHGPAAARAPAHRDGFGYRPDIHPSPRARRGSRQATRPSPPATRPSLRAPVRSSASRCS